MVMAPTAGSPPYRHREAVKETVTRLSVDCMINGDTPSAATGRMTELFSRKKRRWSFSFVRLPSRNAVTQTAETHCARTVARAAPRTPMFSPKMNTGSSTIFTTAPTSTAGKR